jgi:hypothetical protein
VRVFSADGNQLHKTHFLPCAVHYLVIATTVDPPVSQARRVRAEQVIGETRVLTVKLSIEGMWHVETTRLLDVSRNKNSHQVLKTYDNDQLKLAEAVWNEACIHLLRYLEVVEVEARVTFIIRGDQYGSLW